MQKALDTHRTYSVFVWAEENPTKYHRARKKNSANFYSHIKPAPLSLSPDDRFSPGKTILFLIDNKNSVKSAPNVLILLKINSSL